jgi:lipoyl(octanoyl) transferase
MPPNVRRLGLKDFAKTWRDMQGFTLQRNPETPDEIWIVEHPPVYTQGLSGKQEHLLNAENIPVILTDRGGQITYHGPGQLVIYTMINIQRCNLGIRKLVSLLEQAMLTTLSQYGIAAKAKPQAPGVYIQDKKIGSVGLRIKKGCSYHGLSLNNQMDLHPFTGINTCGYPDLEVTSLAEQGILVDNDELAVPLVHYLCNELT